MPRTPQRSGLPIDAFVSRFGARVQAVSACRQDFVGWMHRADVDDRTVDELEVVFSELAANAVDASATTSHDVGVRARVDDDVLVLEISNHTKRPDLPSLPPVPHRDDTLRQRGRGLLIARSFVDSLQTETRPPDRFIVRCTRRLRGR